MERSSEPSSLCDARSAKVSISGGCTEAMQSATTFLNLYSNAGQGH